MRALAVSSWRSWQAKHFFQVSSSFVYDVILRERKFVVKQGAHVTSYIEIKNFVDENSHDPLT